MANGSLGDRAQGSVSGAVGLLSGSSSAHLSMALCERDKVSWEAAPAAQFHRWSSSDQTDDARRRLRSPRPARLRPNSPRRQPPTPLHRTDRHVAPAPVLTERDGPTRSPCAPWPWVTSAGPRRPTSASVASTTSAAPARSRPISSGPSSANAARTWRGSGRATSGSGPSCAPAPSPNLVIPSHCLQSSRPRCSAGRRTR
jgi:hypothetical protein